MKTQPGFKLGGEMAGMEDTPCLRHRILAVLSQHEKARIRGAFLVQGLRTLSFTDSERVACSTGP